VIGLQGADAVEDRLVAPGDVGRRMADHFPKSSSVFFNS
jgi:hypothetical protein